MKGIIYKFTITASRYKFDGHKPFYVGQRWEKRSIEYFLSSEFHNYTGSGSIWKDFVNKLKSDYPDNWRTFIKREVICSINVQNKKALNQLEKYWIRKAKSHYSYRKGGCNVLWGAANENVDLDPIIIDKMRKSKIGKHLSEETKIKISKSLKGKRSGKNHPMYGRHISEEHKDKIRKSMRGENNPMKNKELAIKMGLSQRGKTLSEEQKEKIRRSKLGSKQSDETRRKISESLRKYATNRNRPFGIEATV